jgi:membrane fusion protein
MTQKLFRQEALDHQRDTWLGDVVLSRPPAFALLAWLFFAIALVLVAYLVWGEYTKKARAAGYLVPESGLIKIHAQQPGAVTALKVVEGQQVAKGDVLAIVSTERTSAQGDTQAEVSRQLVVRRESLQAEKAKIHQLYAQQSESARTRIAQMRQEVEQLAQGIEGQEQRAKLSERVVQRHVQLFQEKFVSEALLQEKRADLLDQQSRLRDLRRGKLGMERDLVALQSELAGYALRERNEVAALERSISELAANGLENEARRESYVLAPQSGTVTALQVGLGKQVNPQQPLMSMVPAGARLLADFYVPSRAIGFVRTGSAARLQYEAFPYQKFGSQAGTVVRVSRTAVPAAELPFPATGADVFYVVTVAPAQDHILAYGKPEALTAGMQVAADIWLDRRTLLEWMFEPLFSVTGKV